MGPEEREFAEIVQRHRRELQVHCYRMTGSLVESEELVQETFLRAWRRRETFQGRSTFRAWLYRIATNACLDALSRRPKRVLPPQVMAPVSPEGPLPAPTEHPWLEPYPDHLIEEGPAPDQVAVSRETIGLAFLAAIQHLPPRQRAVLLMREVIGWSAQEVADTLELTVAAVKSALQRARATLASRLPSPEQAPPAQPTEEERAVLLRYLQAHEQGDPDALASVLCEDVQVSYVPQAFWAQGRELYVEATAKHAAPGEYRFLPTQANRQPASALYRRSPGEAEFQLIAVEVLRMEGGRIAQIDVYTSRPVLAAFGLPLSLP